MVQSAAAQRTEPGTLGSCFDGRQCYGETFEDRHCGRQGSVDPRRTKKGDYVEPKGGFKYGWQIRGPDGEFVIGSVVNLSIRGDEARDLLDQAWTNGHMLAPFVKSLIRGSLKFGDKEIPPKVDVMRQVWSEFLVSVNGKITGKRRR